MEPDESTPTTGAPYKDTPEVVPSDQRLPVHDPAINTAASKRSRGARQTSRGRADQRQGDTAPYEEVAHEHEHAKDDTSSSADERDDDA
jgi:hypothetical protein